MAWEDLKEHLAEAFGDVRHDRYADGVTLLQPFLPDRLKRTPEGYARKALKKALARKAKREAAKLCACGCGRPLLLPRRKRGGTQKRYLGECAQRVNTAQKRESRLRQRLRSA